MYFPLSRSLLVYLSRFLSEHLMKRSHLGQLWAGRQQGSWATCSNSPCLYFSRSHCQVIVIGLTFQCNRCGNNFAPINNMEKRLCRAGHLNRRSQSTSSSNTLLWKIEISMVTTWIKLPQKWQILTFPTPMFGNLTVHTLLYVNGSCICNEKLCLIQNWTKEKLSCHT